MFSSKCFVNTYFTYLGSHFQMSCFEMIIQILFRPISFVTPRTLMISYLTMERIHVLLQMRLGLKAFFLTYIAHMWPFPTYVKIPHMCVQVYSCLSWKITQLAILIILFIMQSLYMSIHITFKSTLIGTKLTSMILLSLDGHVSRDCTLSPFCRNPDHTADIHDYGLSQILETFFLLMSCMDFWGRYSFNWYWPSNGYCHLWACDIKQVIQLTCRLQLAANCCDLSQFTCRNPAWHITCLTAK